MFRPLVFAFLLFGSSTSWAQTTWFVPDDFSEEERHAVCQFLDPGKATHCLVEKHLVEVVKIYDEVYTFVSDHAIVCTWEER